MNTSTFLVALSGLLLAPFALADEDCRQRMPAWIEQAHPGFVDSSTALQDARGDYQVDIHGGTCKVWPARPHLTLVAVPLVRSVDDGFGETDLDVLVIDSASDRIYARLIEPNRLSWDAIRVDGLAFDTAPYRLKDNDIAFGVRIARRNGSGPNPFYETSLNLYELQAQQLRPLLNELVMRSSWAEWDTRCAGEFSKSTGVLIVTNKKGRNGYYDLLLKQTRVGSRREDVAGMCETVDENTHRQQHRITYGEQRYLLPIELSPI